MDIEDTQNGQFQLSQALEAHTREARCVDIKGNYMISGGTDNVAMLYTREDPTKKWDIKHGYKFFGGFVMDVCFMEDNTEFVVGCQDGKIYICSTDDCSAPTLIFEGHKKPVNCVRYRNFNIFSGSWDGTACIWDLETGDVKSTLGGHPEFLVAVCPLNNDLVVTGGQDGSLHLWKYNGQKVSEKIGAHQGLIRQIAVVEGGGFMTCSNDETVKVWDLELSTQFTFQNHSSYVFCIKNLQPQAINFVSGGDDKKVVVFENSQISQQIQHTNSVWGVTVDYETGDIITACADKVIYVFTRHQNKLASPEEIKNFEEMGKNLQQATALDETKVQSYPHVCDMKKFRGKKHEDLKIFRKDDDKAYAYQWNMIENKWNEVGEVLAEQGGGNIYF